MAILEVNDVNKAFGGLRALNAVNLSVEEGTVHAIIGPNGAGKSTLIKLILGLVKFNQGTGTVLDMDIRKNGRKIRAHVGYMPEDDCYVAGMSGVEVVRFSACLAGIPEIEALRRSHEILDFCGMGQERYREIEKYSTGMRQKIKFAQSIVHDPQILIFDEPTTGLDPEERDAMLNRVRLLAHKFKKTVILSTHILPDVRDVCDDVVIIAKGQVRLEETMEVLNQPAEPSASIRIKGEVEDFIPILNQNNIRAWKTENYITIETIDNQIPKNIWQVAESSGFTILNLEPAMMSLLQVFMEAVKAGEKHANS